MLTSQRNYQLLTISVDVVFDKINCNLLDDGICSFWENQIYAGRVLGSIQGPPCELWSIARFTELLGRVVPPIRSRQEPWGVARRSHKQYMQLMAASKLLWTSLRLMLALVKVGGFSLLEHPAEPWIADAPSIWRLDAVKVLAGLSISDKITFKQNRFGQYAPKPTTFLAIRLRTLRKWIMQGPDIPFKKMDRAASIGVQADESFHTAGLKECPEALCRVISLAVVDEVDHVVSHSVSDSDSDFDEQQFLNLARSLEISYDPYDKDYEVQMGTDFANL
jgi:hypothetical protein